MEAPSTAHKVLRECCLGVEVEVESSSSGAASVAPAAAASAAGCSGVVVIVAIVGGRHCWYSARDMSSGVDSVLRLDGYVLRFMLVIFEAWV